MSYVSVGATSSEVTVAVKAALPGYNESAIDRLYDAIVTRAEKSVAKVTKAEHKAVHAALVKAAQAKVEKARMAAAAKAKAAAATAQIRAAKAQGVGPAKLNQLISAAQSATKTMQAAVVSSQQASVVYQGAVTKASSAGVPPAAVTEVKGAVNDADKVANADPARATAVAADVVQNPDSGKTSVLVYVAGGAAVLGALWFIFGRD